MLKTTWSTLVLLVALCAGCPKKKGADTGDAGSGSGSGSAAPAPATLRFDVSSEKTPMVVEGKAFECERRCYGSCTEVLPPPPPAPAERSEVLDAGIAP